MGDSSEDPSRSRDATGEPRGRDLPGDRPHDATLRFEYESPARARVVARSVAREVGEIDGDRSAAAVEREDDAVVVRVVADDLVALRAGCNTWGSLVEVAERTSNLA
ncbi:rpo operon protein [Halorussus gelatinilyticus]|uniref:Rpo operon protein n=1 Tax=Halorussus gelatinilyticus TaxID=2937524 RepID=A0A8U0IE96_9EURY|nr:KEOPS complex subunit Pcc1 [Halorussus gelatinilyticus]UPV99020.1 rpo operon protein [Halorussus gelatinilyticus]